MSKEQLPNMPSEFKENWLKALRSGKYEQTREALNDGDGYCCLGVLLDVCSPEDWVKDPMTHKSLWGCTHNSFTSGVHGEEHINPRYNDGELSPELLKKFGLSAEEAQQLMTFNDDDRQTFLEIANWIETGTLPEYGI